MLRSPRGPKVPRLRQTRDLIAGGRHGDSFGQVRGTDRRHLGTHPFHRPQGTPDQLISGATPDKRDHRETNSQQGRYRAQGRINRVLGRPDHNGVGAVDPADPLCGDALVPSRSGVVHPAHTALLARAGLHTNQRRRRCSRRGLHHSPRSIKFLDHGGAPIGGQQRRVDLGDGNGQQPGTELLSPTARGSIGRGLQRAPVPRSTPPTPPPPPQQPGPGHPSAPTLSPRRAPP